MSGPLQQYGTLQPQPRHTLNTQSRPLGHPTKSYKALCADSSPIQHLTSPMTTSAITSPTISHSGSSAQNDSESTDEFEPPDDSQVFSSCSSPLSSTHSWLDVQPICTVEPQIGYGKDRIFLVENLICKRIFRFTKIHFY
jgi:hypothetical protein